MESGCEELKGTFGIGTSLIVLMEICIKLVANAKDILGPIDGGDCDGACAGGSNQGGLNTLLFNFHFLPVKVGS
eukprot:7305952-Ditylum_brightwellii.AAC.1